MADKKEFKPVKGYVLITPLEQDELIALPGDFKEESNIGTVKKTSEGAEIYQDKSVVYMKYTGEPVGKDRIINVNDILAVEE